jgi:hypothetical protein
MSGWLGLGTRCSARGEIRNINAEIKILVYGCRDWSDSEVDVDGRRKMIFRMRRHSLMDRKVTHKTRGWGRGVKLRAENWPRI